MPVNTNIDSSKLSVDTFLNGDFDLVGEYPQVPPEVLTVFTGMADGLIDQVDITLDSAIVGEKVWDAWFSQLPAAISGPLLVYCLGYMADKADDIYDIIGDTRVFELPEIKTPNLNLPQFKLHKANLDEIFEELKDKLKELWPDDESKSEQNKQKSQTTDLTKLEEELKKVIDFVNNPTAPITAEYNRALKKLKDIQDQLSEFNEDFKEAARRLAKLDLKALAKQNDLLFLEMTGTLDTAIQGCCDGMINFLESQQDALAEPAGDDFDEYYRMELVIENLEGLKSDPQPMKDYVNAYIRKKELEALAISIDNQKQIENLWVISVNYQTDTIKLAQQSTDMASLGEMSYKHKVALLEGNRFCDCIRIFNKIKKVENGVKDLFIKGVRLFIEANFPNMKKFEINMLVSCISKNSPSQGGTLKDINVDRLQNVASKIQNTAQEIIDFTEDSNSRAMNFT